MTQRRISPGTYLRRRREAAGLSLRDTAVRFAGADFYADAAERTLAAAEIDTRVLDPQELVRLRQFVRFDSEIYGNLVAGVPTVPICSVCACSWFDPCRDGAHGCAWADGRHDGRAGDGAAGAVLDARRSRSAADQPQPRRPGADGQ